MCLLPLLFMVIVRSLKLNNEADIKVIMRLALMAIAAWGVYSAYRGKLKPECAVTMIILAAIVLRWGYTMYTPTGVRAYDIGPFEKTANGHAGYIYNILSGHLPESNVNQFYHPPLFYMLSAAFMKAASLITRKTEIGNFLYMSQMVSCTAACLVPVFTDEILKRMNAGGFVRAAALLLIAVFPAQILASGRVNNDALVLLLMVMALYFTLLWHKEQKMSYIIGIAVTIGAGMMTKLNGGLVALVTGPIMLYHLIKTIRSKNKEDIKNIIIQLAVFAVICFPLGLWYPIRNYIKFGQPLNYVLDQGKNSFVYTGDASFAEKWLHVPFLHFK